MTRVTKTLAIARLKVAGYHNAAAMLDRWRSDVGTNQGWDGHMRRFPNLARAIWPQR